MARLEQLLTPTVLVAATVVSIVLFFASLLGVSWAVCRLPADHLLARRPVHLALGKSIVARIALNVLGAILVMVGIALLLLPGQGLLTIATGLILVDFPGKARLERKLLTTPAISRAVNRIRHRAGRPPLSLPPRP